MEVKASEVQIEKEGQATLKDFAEYLDKDSENYLISLTKTASITGGIPNLENATEMYVTYNNFEFKVEKNLKITYVGSQNTSGNGSGNGSGSGSGSGGSSSTGGGSSSNTLYGCRRYIEVEVTDAIMGEMTLNVEIPNKDKIKAIEYYINGKLVHTGLERSYTVTGLQSEVEYNVSAIVEYEPDEILTIAKVQDIGIVSVNSTHTASEKTIGWEMLERFAKIISDNEGTGEKQVNSDSAGITFAVGKETYTIGIGDTFTLDGKKVRLLGFNHDELVDKTVYGGNNTHAGISFEYVDFITTAAMNGTNTNVGSWARCELRKTLNSDTTLNNISIESKIKEVTKTYNRGTENSTCTDKLWLLACSEIWQNGVQSGYYGYCKTKEGDQYAYYKANNASFNVTSQTATRKSGGYWWIRSPRYDDDEYFCFVSNLGDCGTNGASISYGVAPGFAI